MKRKNKLAMHRIKPLIFLMMMGMVFAAGCGPQEVSRGIAGESSAPQPPQAWIDAPLNESHLPLAPYEIVFHISGDPDIALGELSINDEVTALLPVEDAGKKLATLKYLWEPDNPGKYVLHTRARTENGEWGPIASAVVYIAVDAVPESTPTVTPEADQAEGISNIQIDPDQVNIGSCLPNQLTISANASTPAGVKKLIIFYRFSSNSGGLTDWQNESMAAMGDGKFQKLIDMTTAAQITEFSSQQGIFIYQLIIEDNSGELIRGEVRRDVYVTRCEGFQMPLFGTVMPQYPIIMITPTPIIIR